MQKTSMLTKEEAIKNRKWYLVDASGLVLGKLAVKAANLIRGKNKANFTPNQDCGDHLIIINSDQVVLTGNKKDNEFWYHHSQYMGGIKKTSGRDMINKNSDKLVFNAVKGMLPDNRLSRRLITKVHVFKNDKHNMEAQKPTLLNWS
ncbi:50S ribosomal protein L13 [Mycoplasmoides genitalium]|uniref:Large ribosomal subunit protein uL13 n=2 Tax=Mycoplasmoides genitalium TaxID=2097 RepID=RL13_MYCGE|nr:50S ribosomal protein L13 [Mycoplasmoides genitalium]P47657.1 RecName: Full=Large ribosomal subunit protein uL13; AltName: Full=50S ribosomal protein L13 [Mycoplasmoides genitalium G37]AAC71644.1 ribosomal protein L13 [Mycoplasmoides genitalium G37]ABY79328.1 ribosomal protein L13 [synthetic Mycoplasma genitalium JCVI-1.0]